MPVTSHPPFPCLASTLVVAVLAGCSPAPPARPVAAAKPHAHADHDHDDDDHGDHDHDHADRDAKSADHDHEHDHGDHDHPATLAEGIRALARTAASVKEHLAAESRDDVDDAVHAVAHLIEDAQGLVQKSGLADDAKAAAAKALDELFDCFDKLDTALHASPGEGESPADVHASVAKRVEEAIAALRQAAGHDADADDHTEDR